MSAKACFEVIQSKLNLSLNVVRASILDHYLPKKLYHMRTAFVKQKMIKFCTKNYSQNCYFLCNFLLDKITFNWYNIIKIRQDEKLWWLRVRVGCFRKLRLSELRKSPTFSPKKNKKILKKYLTNNRLHAIIKSEKRKGNRKVKVKENDEEDNK